MRTAILTIALLTASISAPPAAALDDDRSDRKASLSLIAREPQGPVLRRAGRTLAAFEVGEQAVTVAAFGRRARARALGNADDIRHARAMGKVFDGAPQPALVTFEVSLRF